MNEYARDVGIVVFSLTVSQLRRLRPSLDVRGRLINPPVIKISRASKGFARAS